MTAKFFETLLINHGIMCNSSPSCRLVQVLVYHDVLGILHHPHYEKHVPSFCKRYSTLGSDIHIALSQYRAEVHEGLFPSSQYSPYKMPEEEKKKFEEMLLSDMVVREDVSKKVEKRLKDADEYETVNLY